MVASVIFEIAMTVAVTIAAFIVRHAGTKSLSQNRTMDGRDIATEEIPKQKKRYRLLFWALLTPLLYQAVGFAEGFSESFKESFHEAAGGEAAPADAPAPESSKAAAFTLRPTQFTIRFNATAERFGLDARLDHDLTFSQGEQAQTATFEFPNVATVMLSRAETGAPLSGIILGLQWADDLDLLQALQYLYTLIATIEPEMTDDAIGEFAQRLTSTPGDPVFTANGTQFSAQSINDQAIFVFVKLDG